VPFRHVLTAAYKGTPEDRVKIATFLARAAARVICEVSFKKHTLFARHLFDFPMFARCTTCHLCKPRHYSQHNYNTGEPP
jgi:hypothetical protein